jgi:type IX secretion system PorP/SprF family membrane protein
MICKYGLFLLCALVGRTLHAQSDYDLTQRWFNEAIYNPGAVGNSLTTGAFLHARAQWVGTDGAPITQVAAFDTYVEQLNSGFGVVLLHDQIGYLNTYNLKASYAYYIPIDDHSSLSLGLSAGWLNRNRNITDDMAEESPDPILVRARASQHDPEFDFGFEYKGAFKLGASVRHLGLYAASDFAAPPLTVWAYASSRFKLSNIVSIEPCVSYNYRTDIHYFEAGALFYFLHNSSLASYHDKLWIGGMYRLQRQVAVLFGVHITPRIRLGYSFDYGFGDLAAISDKGTHEIFFAWQFNRIFYKDVCCPALKR